MSNWHNQIWAEVFDPTLTSLGVVDLVSASITKSLDIVGTISIVAATTDPMANELLQIWRTIKIYWRNPNRGVTFVGGGVLLSSNVNASGSQVTWSGQDISNELRRITTWRGLEYNDQSVEDVIDDLIGMVPGWEALIDGGLGNTSRRYDGQSVLRAILAVVEGIGVHTRLLETETTKFIEVGQFGDDSGLRMARIEVPAKELSQNPDLIIINALSVIEDGFEIKNVVEPVWGSGAAVLTLRRSTRTSPYPILERPGPDGRTIYYLENTASVAQYGEVQGVITMFDAPYIAPDGGVSVVNAANVVYDWGASELDRLSMPKKVYQASGLKLDRELKPGEKLRLFYKGLTYRNGVAVNWLDVDDDFWVLSVSQNYSNRGQSISVQISNIDQAPADAASMIADSMIVQETASIAQRTTSAVNVTSDDLTVNPGSPGVLTFEISTLTAAIGNSNLLMTRPDPSRPDTISVAIDAIDRTSELGGPWFVGALDNDPVKVAIEEILDVGDIRGEHTITVSAALRSGTIETVVEITEIGVTS